MKTQVLLDTTYIPSYEEYVEYCEENESVPQGKNSHDYWDFVYRERECECDDLLGNLKYSKVNNDYHWVISGTLGLWNGRREVYQTLVDNLESAIRQCAGECDYIVVKKRGSVIYISAMHHDGTNSFEIRALTDVGRDRLERNGTISLNNRENIVTLPKYLF